MRGRRAAKVQPGRLGQKVFGQTQEKGRMEGGKKMKTTGGVSRRAGGFQFGIGDGGEGGRWALGSAAIRRKSSSRGRHKVQSVHYCHPPGHGQDGTVAAWLRLLLGIHMYVSQCASESMPIAAWSELSARDPRSIAALRRWMELWSCRPAAVRL